MRLSIRAATAAEAPLLAPIERAADQRYLDSPFPELAESDGIPDDVAHRYCSDGRILVADLDGTIVGFVGWHLEEASSDVEIAQVSVLPEAGGRGLGASLVRAVIDIAVERGSSRVVLATQLDVPWNEPWYRGLGFATLAREHWTEPMRRVVADQHADGLSWDRRVWMHLDISILQGGVANAGAVVRAGDEVLRPRRPNSATIHRLLRHVHERGFDGAPVPVSWDDDRERLGFLPGDVPVPPYPAWARSDDALASTARLLRRLHDASLDFDRSGATWSDEMSDHTTDGGEVICHNDVCLENVVFRDGVAVALLDFDFAAPGRRVHDVAAFARMCVPVDDDTSAARLGWEAAVLPRRLRLVADAYDLDPGQREALLTCLDGSIARGGAFVLRHVEAGEPGFVQMWEAMGGIERFDRRRAWWATARPAFGAALR